jgi:hypothetical protein
MKPKYKSFEGYGNHGQKEIGHPKKEATDGALIKKTLPPCHSKEQTA